MQIALIGKDTLYKLSLPKTVIGNYWLTDQNKKNEKKLINVEGKNGKWQLIINERTNVIDATINEDPEQSQSNFESNMEESITNSITTRQEYLEGLSAQAASSTTTTTNTTN